MNKVLAAALLVHSLATLFAQSKRSDLWLLGNGIPSYPKGGINLRFIGDSIQLTEVNRPNGTVHATCNDEGGNLLFYYNYCTISNRVDETMDNGEDMNYGSYAHFHDCSKYGDDAGQRSGALIFPMPDNKDLYSLLHIRNVQTTLFTALNDRLQLTTVDMSANNGLGKVLEKDQPVILDSLHDAIAAVRHGNGRDWWIIVPRGLGREFWELQLTPKGLTAPNLISIPKPWPPPSDPEYEYARESWGAQARFSPDGSKYVRYSRGNGAEIYDFDRCSGAMTFRRMLPEPPSAKPDEYPVLAGGLCVSPNSKYLYYNNTEFLYQFDLCEDNLGNPESEPILIDTWVRDTLDGVNTFFLMRNAPDGKIYMNSTNGCKSLHVIHKPNLPGKACNLVQASLRLPDYNSWIWGDFQNFDLYDLADSPCDSLGIDDPNPPKKLPDAEKLTLYPNPANDEVNVFIPGCGHSSLLIYNVSGILIEKIPFVEGNLVHTISTSDWSAGVYFFKFRSEMDKASSVAKLVVVH